MMSMDFVLVTFEYSMYFNYQILKSLLKNTRQELGEMLTKTSFGTRIMPKTNFREMQ